MKAPYPDLQNLDADQGDPPDRLISLSDGIFAFAMTLLAINVELPTFTANSTVDEVTQHVVALLPQFFIFATSFLLVALYWTVHRRTFRYIVRSDTTLTWLNILQLLFVAFLPVATGLFDTYNYVPAVVLIYGGTLSIIGIIGILLWRHATDQHRLVDPKLSPEVIRYYRFRGEFTVAVYVFYTLVGYLNPEIGRWLLLVLLLTYPFLTHGYRFLRQRNILRISEPNR